MLSLFTDVFDGFLRFLSAILAREGRLDEDAFWATVADVVRAGQVSVPERADRIARDDLFVERFDLSCLNRLQLRDNKQMVNLSDPAGGRQVAGTLPNPLARHRR